MEQWRRLGFFIPPHTLWTHTPTELPLQLHSHPHYTPTTLPHPLRSHTHYTPTALQTPTALTHPLHSQTHCTLTPTALPHPLHSHIYYTPTPTTLPIPKYFPNLNTFSIVLDTLGVFYSLRRRVFFPSLLPFHGAPCFYQTVVCVVSSCCSSAKGESRPILFSWFAVTYGLIPSYQSENQIISSTRIHI